MAGTSSKGTGRVNPLFLLWGGGDVRSFLGPDAVVVTPGEVRVFRDGALLMYCPLPRETEPQGDPTSVPVVSGLDLLVGTRILAGTTKGLEQLGRHVVDAISSARLRNTPSSPSGGR